ncbi:winged helix-turn-helix transcriptional regulator [Rhizobium leguminosarum]|nr:winged helix-turn-helix transcriptional regulator [Rhizobium leguminosarum]
MKDSFTEDFDRTDLKILRALQSEGRLTNADLAERVNVSAATCHRRTQRLFDEGYITGVRAEVAPAAVGRGALVMVGVVLDRSTPESFAAFEGAVMEMKEVLDCNVVAGDFDYLQHCCMDQTLDEDNPIHCIFHATRSNLGRPSSVIRLRTRTPIFASVF